MIVLVPEAWELMRALIATLEAGPPGAPQQFLAVPLAAGGGLVGHAGGHPIRVDDMALIAALAARGFLALGRTPHGLTLLTVTPAGRAATLAWRPSASDRLTAA